MNSTYTLGAYIDALPHAIAKSLRKDLPKLWNVTGETIRRRLDQPIKALKITEVEDMVKYTGYALPADIDIMNGVMPDTDVINLVKSE